MATIKRTPVEPVIHTTGKNSRNEGAQYAQWRPFDVHANSVLADKLTKLAAFRKEAREAIQAMEDEACAAALSEFALPTSTPLTVYQDRAFTAPWNDKAMEGKVQRRTAAADKPRASAAELLARFGSK